MPPLQAPSGRRGSLPLGREERLRDCSFIIGVSFGSNSTLIHHPTPFLLPMLGEGRGLLVSGDVE
jgi:hypothetical protein